MAQLPLYKMKTGANSRRVQFPSDYVRVGMAEVDDALLPRLLLMPTRGWGMDTRPCTSYARYQTKATGRQVVHKLHRVVWELVHGPIPPGLTIDHFNHDGLDCRASNLRLADEQQQKRSRRKPRTANGAVPLSRFKGTRFRSGSSGSPWWAQIQDGSGKIYLGSFPTELEAAFAYNVAAALLFGAYAVPNAIPPGSLTPLDEARIEALVRRKLGLP